MSSSRSAAVHQEEHQDQPTPRAGHTSRATERRTWRREVLEELAGLPDMYGAPTYRSGAD